VEVSYIVLPPLQTTGAHRFSLRFCRKYMARELSGRHARRMEGRPPTCGESLAFSGEKGVLVLQPLTIACADSLAVLEQASGEDGWDLLCPQLGGAGPGQTPLLPFAYHDLASYEETARWLKRKAGPLVRKVSAIGDDMFFCSRPFLGSLPRDLPITLLPGSQLVEKARKGMVEGALAHSFSGYFAHGREDLASLVPAGARSVLDVGCGAGGLGARLKSSRPDLRVVGVEPVAEAAAVASKHYDRVHVGPVESFSPEEPFDCIVCGDLLEHLNDPWSVLEHLGRLLRRDGTLIGSSPNAGHWSVVKGLIEGRFEYVPAGILCWDHLRFFTEESLRAMLTSAGFGALTIRKERPTPTPRGQEFLSALEAAGLGEKETLETAEFVFTARKA